MGNEQSVYQQKGYKVRHRSIDASNPSQSHRSRIISRHEVASHHNQSFATPPINNSFSRNLKQMSQEEPEEDEEDDPQQSEYQKQSRKSSRRYLSIDVNEEKQRVRYRQAPNKRSENDKVLENLSKKNQILRKELKKISDDLSNQLKKKKFVPKKKPNKDGENDEDQIQTEYKNKQAIGLKRQLDNAYKQIDMYKRTIQNLKGREEGDNAQYKLSKLTNDITIVDGQIEKYLKKIEGVKNIKNKQDRQVEKDLNDDMREGIASYKKQAEQLKQKLKELQNRDRQRQTNYKKQQAYLCDLEKKARELNGEYFPELKTHLKKDQHRTVASEKDKERVNPKEFQVVHDEAMKMRLKHEEYYRKIDQLLKQKNRVVQDQNDFKEQVLYKERVIQALKIKIQAIKKILKPNKKGFFGYGSSNFEGSDINSEYNDTPSEIQRQIQEQLNQDQFDIKHLIANIPKPVRKKPQEISNGYSSAGSSGESPNKKGGGMVVTSEKAQPKKWGAVSTRTEERGKHFQGELHFEDRGQFDSDVQPLIVGVNTWVNKNSSVVGIQAVYMNNKQLRYGVKSCDSTDGSIKRFDLQSPDYLKNITMTVSNDGFIESISLYSKQGKVGKFGNKREYDENINFGLSSNERPFMLMGGTTLFEGEPRLNFLGLEICTQ